jgi:hypothetical protein
LNIDDDYHDETGKVVDGKMDRTNQLTMHRRFDA